MPRLLGPVRSRTTGQAFDLDTRHAISRKVGADLIPLVLFGTARSAPGALPACAAPPYGDTDVHLEVHDGCWVATGLAELTIQHIGAPGYPRFDVLHGMR